ncbi:MAG: heavy-metal-associated domain-containing protein [Chloroflexi bacterium]|nr:heavy-metal-associated domain-containing protein [Chloroflexota bacterium]
MKGTKRLIFAIEGLGCGGGGALTVERALTRTAGVARTYVSPATEMAYVEYDPTTTSPDRLVAAVEGVGFRVSELNV